MRRAGRWIRHLVVASALTLMASTTGWAQGVTTGAIAGTVTDNTGRAIEEATVRIINPETGFARTVTTRGGGRYVMTGLEVGIYRVSVAAVGFRATTREDIRVTLSQTARADFALEAFAVALQELVVEGAAAGDVFAPNRTGAQTAISDSAVSRLPTLNRQLQDFVKLTPQVTINPNVPGDIIELSIGGQNNRFNAIQVDGSTQNDRFGLGSTGELGGQAGGRGISLEAVKEYQIVVSPYTVTQGGFTGGLVNAVTKSGTNDWRASGFFTYRNNKLASDDPFIANSEFNVKQFGLSVGGPLITDRLHLFVAGELNRTTRPANGPYLGQPASSGEVRVNEALINRFTAALAQYGIQGGSGGQVNNENPITNLVARLDYQLNESNRLVVREIYNEAAADDFSRSAATFALTSNRFKRSEDANSFTVQWFKNFASGANNEFQVGWVRQRFERAFDQIGPQITVVGVPSPTVGGALVNLRAGPDSNSHINQLDQDFFELRNDFTFTPRGAPKHLITLGTRSDLYKVRNAFWQNAYGSWRFSSLEDLEAGTPFAYGVGVGVGDDPIARFKAANVAIYAQDQWAVNRNLTLLLGLRAEGPIFFDKPGYREEVERDHGRRTDEIPSNITFNPRLGFNWDLGGRQMTQVRGGVGLFAGIPPYVWLSNLFTNNGRSGIAQFTCDGQSGRPAPPPFNSETVQDAPQTCGGTGPGVGTNIGNVNTVDPNFKLTQVFRATLGGDHRLPGGFVASLDAMYTKSLNSPYMVNLALADPVGTDYAGRVMYGTLAATTGIPTTTALSQPAIYSGGVYDLRNSSKDYAYSVTGGVSKRFSESWEASAFYTYGRSYSVQDFTSSVAASNFRNGRVTAVNQYDDRVDPSAFDRPHRMVATITYSAPWKNFPTDISFIYQGQSGTPFTYVYSGSSGRGDVNADGVGGNDPIYIPNSASQLTFGTIAASGDNPAITPAEQAAAFDEFLAAMPCLDSQRGQIMQRNSCRNPWWNSLDLSVRQSLPQVMGNRLSLQADIFNFLNFLNSDWGKIRSNGRFPQINLLNVTGRAEDGRPIVTFSPALTDQDVRFPKVNTNANFWQAQLTLRYAY